MQATSKSPFSNRALTGLCATAMTLGLTTGSALAHDDKGNDNHYDHSGAPHETPYKAEPPPGGHGSLAKAATNPIADLDTTWDYNHKSGKWTLPTGPRVGKVMKIGQQPVNLFGAVYYNPNSDGPTAAWTAKINLTLLFPK